MLNFKFVLILITCLTVAATAIDIRPGVALPHAEELEHMIKANLFPNKTEGQSFVDLYGNITEADNETIAKLENLEFSVLDRDNLKLLVDLARRKGNLFNTLNARRQFGTVFHKVHVHMTIKMLDLMQQSIYAARYRLEKTKPIRSRYRDDYEFKMGIMYGALMDLRFKAAFAYSTMGHLRLDDAKFIWYLILYEKILKIHSDVTSSVNRIFDIVIRAKSSVQGDVEQKANEPMTEPPPPTTTEAAWS